MTRECVDREQLKNMIRGLTKWYVKRDNAGVGQPNTAVGLLYDDVMFGIDRLHPVTPQEPKIKVLERDEAARKLGTVDIYQARAWITLLNDLEYLKLKICEVEE